MTWRDCPRLPFSKLFVLNCPHLCLGCIGEQYLWNRLSWRACEGSICPIWYPQTASVGTLSPVHRGDVLLRDVPGLCKILFQSYLLLAPRSLCVEKCLFSSFRLASLCRRWKVVCDRKTRESPGNWAEELRLKCKYCLLWCFLSVHVVHAAVSRGAEAPAASTA